MWDLIVSVPDHCLSFDFYIFTVSDYLGLLDSDIRKQNTAIAGARGK